MGVFLLMLSLNDQSAVRIKSQDGIQKVDKSPVGRAYLLSDKYTWQSMTCAIVVYRKYASHQSRIILYDSMKIIKKININ